MRTVVMDLRRGPLAGRALRTANHVAQPGGDRCSCPVACNGDRSEYAAAAGERLVANLLLGLKGADPVTLIWASLLLLGIATAAAHWQRSMLPESDPLMALRYE